MVILMTILFSLLFISQSSHAEIYKWVDEKGTVNFTEDPETIPEKYRDKATRRMTEVKTAMSNVASAVAAYHED